MLNWSWNREDPQAAPAEVRTAQALEPSAPPAVEKSAPKARLALALGGGAARGWAHIGVLRAIDEAGIEVGMIAGTSIGALVGGCYLAGKLDELESFARSLTMRRIAGLLDLTIGGAGLLGGLRLTKRMQEQLEGLNVEDLDRPFVSVATELHTGHEVWISSGSLITALRASYALPGIFAPVKCNGRTLVDGALVNPVPTSVCRAYEQPLVVAVNLNYDIFGRSAVVRHSASVQPIEEARKSLQDVRVGVAGTMVQAFNIIQERISRARLAGDPPDLALHPRLSDIGLSEFHRAGEAIDRGYNETMTQITALKRMQEVFAR